MSTILCFGEVLWDEFPTHKKIGGAPLNVAVRFQSMRNNVAIISRVGDDRSGRKLIGFLQDQNINTSAVQIDSIYKTGNVKVLLDSNGCASYEIEYPCAWDKIELSEEAIKLTKTSDVFVYGSLASRDEVSKNTLMELLKIAKYKVFDVNLRAPHYSFKVLSDLMNHADFIKFNDDEIFEIGDFLNISTKSLEQLIMSIAGQTKAKSICVTRGKKGAILYNEGKLYYNKGYKVKVVDTVGAGDSFLATLISKLTDNNAPQESLDYACAVGALVTSSEGANPVINEMSIKNLTGVLSEYLL
ncbi:carbohydrate kinase [Seonamhaeicola sp. S2-3]|uniref:carbohydrate kinase family protein n=1 Tax=Seonamhaeicola sp. S2-3 TaxID=1936081 RepID=UPI0009728AD4|nr:carbohydrate kinase [Seonamhaeicola sp. S2-3]APY09839.1 carbohydrate kinase [Seonamhaeicola sp. S2-3]